MKNKKLLYIVGGLAVVGVIYYMYKKKKDSEMGGATDTKEVEDAESTTTTTTGTAGGTGTAGKTEPTTSIAKESRKLSKEEERKYAMVCGKQPVSKKKRVTYMKCVDEQKAKELASATTTTPAPTSTTTTTTPASFDGMNNYFDIHSSMTGEITDNMEIF